MIVAYSAVHYGLDYLYYAVKAVEDVVDKHIILYAEGPSFGYETELVCPDSKENLQAAVASFDHVDWIDGKWSNEGDHRRFLDTCLPGDTEFVVVVDADEVWDKDSLIECLELSTAHDNRSNNFVHLWRSFNWACMDVLAPSRIYNRKVEGGINYIPGRIYHFGYAISPELMRYKWAIHGHRDELRAGWLEKYETWTPGVGDVHPANDKWWYPEPFDKSVMPALMREHPYWRREIIE